VDRVGRAVHPSPYRGDPVSVYLQEHALSDAIAAERAAQPGVVSEVPRQSHAGAPRLPVSGTHIPLDMHIFIQQSYA
jgi:hypothetical protein